MRVLVVTQYFWPESFRVNDLVVGLRDLGHEVEILTGMPNYPGGRLFQGYGFFTPAAENFNGMRVIRVPLITRGRSKGIRLMLNYLSFALSASLLGPWRCRREIDAVLIFEPSPVTVALPALVIARLRRACTLLWIQDLWPDTLSAMGFSSRGLVMRIARGISDFVHQRCDRLLVQSPGFTPRLVGRGINAVRISYLPNWAEDYYRPVPATDTPGHPVAGIAGFKLLFAGNIGSAQSFETILAAADILREVNDLQWVIVGDGLMREWVASEVRRLGLDARVHLLGQRSAEDMPNCFAHADALLVTLRPDAVFSLTIPSKIQSYLACGKIIIAAIDGEGAAVVRDSGAGVVCAASDAEGLAKAVMAVYSMSKEARAKLGAAGRRYYEQHFARSRALANLDRYFRDTVH